MSESNKLEQILELLLAEENEKAEELLQLWDWSVKNNLTKSKS